MCLLQVCLAVPLSAQDVEDPSANARLRLGALRFTPTFVVAGPGLDTNVFNEIDEPKEDWTVRASPKSDWWLRMGRGSFSATTAVEYQYFAKYDNQRAWNTEDSARFAVSLGRFTPFVAGSYLNARQRPSYEIDVRARRREDGLSLGGEFRVLSRTTLVASASRSHVAFDRNDRFLGTALAEALNHRTNGSRLEARQRLSALTTFVVRGERTEDRFDSSTFRDADSTSVMSGFEFKPLALVSGKAFVGYREVRPVAPAVRDFKGVIASLNLAYSFSGSLLAVELGRDVVYSFEPAQPYYLLTDIRARFTQMITQDWDVQANITRQYLAYEQGITAAAVARTDTAFNAGFGVGRWLGRNFRVGVEAALFERQSGLAALRDYRAIRAGLSVRYGLKP